jgi:amino acid transporter
VSQQSVGARLRAGTAHITGAGPGRARAGPPRPIGQWAFLGVAIASFGGPLALAGLAAPGLVADASESAGFAILAATALFVAPLAIWLRFSSKINGSGGLYAFVEAAAGRRIALAQAALWIFSYLLYLIYTTVQIVYEQLPEVVPAERRYQTLLALAIPVAMAAVMIAGRAATLIVLGAIAAGQLALAGILDWVTIAHLSTPASSFGTSAPRAALAKASAQTSLLYVCGSLPLFLGGELARPARTIRRGLVAAFAVTALVIVLAVAPLASAPGLLSTAIPGVAVVEQFASTGLANLIGIGIAVSTTGVILCEYLALTRLLHALTRSSTRTIAVAIGAVIVLAAPFSLIDPIGFYNTLVEPSLVALWLSQLIVFAVYARFAGKHGQRPMPAWALTLIASGLAVYGLWTAVHQAAS